MNETPGYHRRLRSTVALAAAAALIATAAGCRESAADPFAKRDANRAYYGAPPVVPHPVRELGRANCLACHGEGLHPTEGPAAVAKPHGTLGECTQCHVEQQRETPLLTHNRFVGLAEPRDSHAAFPGAPPTIPHRTWLRETCLSCHGPRGHESIRTTHPERANCVQCHVTRDPDAAPLVENRFARSL